MSDKLSQMKEKFSPDVIMKYAWAALIVVVIVVLVVVIILPGTESKSTCSGFQYFVFLNQKMTEDSYSIELLNGVGDIRIRSTTVDGVNIGIPAIDVPSGEKFILTSAHDPTDRKADETFNSRISVLYDVVNGIDNNRDSAACTGKIQ